MSFAVIALLGSALIHPFWVAIPKKAVHPLTMNFWMMIFASIVFSPFLFNADLWKRLSDHWIEYSMLSGFQICYAVLVLTFTKNHHFQIAYPMSRMGPLLVLFGEIYFLQGILSPSQIFGIITVTIGAVLFGFDKHIQKIKGNFFLLLLGVIFTMAGAMILTKKTHCLFFTCRTLGSFGHTNPFSHSFRF